MDAEVAIVGAGIIGCMIAREIVSRRPETSVIVLDRDAVGSGASRRSAGLHIPRGSTDRLRRMTEHSQNYYENLKKHHPLVPIYPLGLYIVASKTCAPELTEVYLGRAALVRSGIRSCAGFCIPEHTELWHAAGGQYADVGRLARSVADGLRGQVGFREGVRVTAIDRRARDIVLRLGTGDRLTAERLVLAPGPWLKDPAWEPFVAPTGARVKKVVCLYLEQLASPGDDAVVFQDDDAFLLPLHDRGRWLFSYRSSMWDVDPDTVETGLSADDLHEARAVLGRYSPELAARAVSGRVFCDAYSGNAEPLIRAVGGDGRIVFAGAASGRGYRLAPAIASDVADVLTFA